MQWIEILVSQIILPLTSLAFSGVLNNFFYELHKYSDELNKFFDKLYYFFAVLNFICYVLD